ncbi:hypothetical protein GCM10009828_059220 [Actinoplanes couchii]|uniref:Uncharacterized protein n=1 Tax=Actinoplanes couchii TaxID=403638 RepID=A0ABQ3XMQ3_9ACTN|nr:hypothetical protein Aco03nite_080890 [Actinoplanes couchii]
MSAGSLTGDAPVVSVGCGRGVAVAAVSRLVRLLRGRLALGSWLLAGRWKGVAGGPLMGAHGDVLADGASDDRPGRLGSAPESLDGAPFWCGRFGKAEPPVGGWGSKREAPDVPEMSE